MIWPTTTKTRPTTIGTNRERKQKEGLDKSPSFLYYITTMTVVHPKFDIIKKNYACFLDIDCEVNRACKNTFETLTGLKVSDEDYKKIQSAQMALFASEISR